MRSPRERRRLRHIIGFLFVVLLFLALILLNLNENVSSLPQSFSPMGPSMTGQGFSGSVVSSIVPMFHLLKEAPLVRVGKIPRAADLAAASAPAVNSMYDLRRVMDESEAVSKAVEPIFTVSRAFARMRIPESFKERALSLFAAYPAKSGGTKFLESQEIIHVMNRYTKENSMFNEIRRYRPGYKERPTPEEDVAIRAMYDANNDSTSCDFCSVNRTAEDVFGRILGKHAYTASNVAKYEKWHGLVVARRHNPLDFDAESIADILDVAVRWFAEVNALDPEYRFPHIVCDIGKKASASQVHLHLQMFITHSQYHMRTEQNRELVRNLAYQSSGTYNYWTDFSRIHQRIGLAVPVGTRSVIISHACPVKERELIVLSEEDPVGGEGSFAKAAAAALMAMRDGAGSRALSLMFTFPPITAKREHTERGEQESPKARFDVDALPTMMRVIDRGSPLDARGDAGGMEFFGGNNVGADPYAIIPDLWEQVAALK